MSVTRSPRRKGAILSVDPDAYFNHWTLRWFASSSILRAIHNDSPAHALEAIQGGRVDTAAFRFGRAVHLKALGAGSPVCVVPDDLLGANGSLSTKAAKGWRDEKEALGLTVIKRDAAQKIDAAAASISQFLVQAGIRIAPARSEMVVAGRVDGVWCKAMIDNAPEGLPILLDLKTTDRAHPECVQRSIASYGYEMQAAHYVDTWKAATGEDRRFLFCFVEKSAPYACALVEIDDRALDMGRAKMAEARRQFSECVATGQWPAYPPQIMRIGLPEWHHARWAYRGADVEIPPTPTATALRAGYEAQKPLDAAE